MTFLTEFTTEFDRFRQKLKLAQHRKVLVLTGDKFWQLQLLEKLEPNAGIWVGKNSPLANLTEVEFSQLRHFLGQEIDAAVFSAEQGISADGLAIVAGMLRAGGILWILLSSDQVFENPANAKFLSYPFELADAKPGFENYLIQQLRAESWLQQTDFAATEIEYPEFQIAEFLPASFSENSNANFQLTSEQQQALNSIQSWQTKPAFRVLIEADRGRGKSSLLGSLAAEFLPTCSKIIISASRFAQTKIAFEQAFNQLNHQQPGLVKRENKSLQLLNNQHEFRFHAPDDLILNQPNCDLLILDEAAHLPLPMLTQLIEIYPKIIFASTLQGYEGSGQGLSLRLKQMLAQAATEFIALELKNPVRWAPNDPLENFINRLLMFNLNLPNLSGNPELKTEDLSLQQVEIANLNQQQLAQIFSLLQQAHYQSTPADLQQLLSAPDLQLMLATIKRTGDLAAVLLVCDEGELPILASNRRVKGHLVPQLLRLNLQQEKYLQLASQRALRIAVHPDLRRQKLGSSLVKFWQQTAQQAGKDYLSVSFGDTPELTNFWQQLGFVSQHLGKKQNKASGRFNRVMTYELVKQENQAWL